MTDEQLMLRALELAQMGLGQVSPNPLVGCVIACEGKIVGEGYHKAFGAPHAEVNAIASVADQSILNRCMMYVTLEPCTHFGKTPPCADLVIRHRLKKVWISMIDPNPMVSGKGIERIRKAGIAVETGLLETAGRQVNRRFFTTYESHRPYVILKWAETRDGFMARENYDSKWISNAYSRQLVHKWRSEEDAILVGTNTARYDNPSLTVRDWSGRHPIRVVIDRDGTLDRNLNLFDGAVKSLYITERKISGSFPQKVECLDLPELTITHILSELHRRGIQSLMVEGGPKLLASFINQDLWDEARVFVGEPTFGTGLPAPQLKYAAKTETKILEDRLTIYSN